VFARPAGFEPAEPGETREQRLRRLGYL